MSQSVNKTVLKNGIRILTKALPHVRSISMGVWVNVGARDESADESGLSHLIEHMIFKGTHKRSAYQIAKEFDAIGGQTNAFTSMEMTCYHARVMDAHLATMVDILSDIFLHSKFDPRELERERPVILQEIGMVEDSPEDYIHTLMSESFWGDTPMGRSILGTKENIARFDPKMIGSFFRRCYQPDRIVISAAGNLVHEQFVDLVGPLFESVTPGTGGFERVAPTPVAEMVIHRRQLEQVHLCLAAEGLCVTDPRRYALSLMNTMLGGNMSSRLFQEIREKRGLAYSVYSYNCSHVDTGLYGIYAGVAPKDVELTLELIEKAINHICREKIDPGELRDAKEFTKGGILLSAESVDNQMVRAAQNEIHLNRDVPLSEITANVEAVTVDDIFDMARGLFQGAPIGTTLLGAVPESMEPVSITVGV
jgi:predicted Zn-dependent peptidase